MIREDQVDLRGLPDNYLVIGKYIYICPVCRLCGEVINSDFHIHLLHCHDGMRLKDYLNDFPDADVERRPFTDCVICNSEDRFIIDAQILSLYSDEKIMEIWKNLFSEDELNRHKNHTLSYRLVKYYTPDLIIDDKNPDLKKFAVFALSRLISRIEDADTLKSVKPKDVIEALKLLKDIESSDKPRKVEVDMNANVSMNNLLKILDEKEKEGNEG